MKITIREVAKQAGVSVGTVSRAFNNYPDISEETKKKVNTIAQKLGYSPNISARRLSSKRTKVIALIINEINISTGLTFPLEVMSGVIAQTEKMDYEFVFYSMSLKKQKEQTLAEFCVEHDISGVILQGLSRTDPYYKELQTTDIPCVVIDLATNNPKVGKISINNEKASYEVGKLLLEYGHKRVFFINGKRDTDVALERESGFRRAFEEAGVCFDEKLVRYANFDEETAYLITKESLGEKEFSAIYATSDLMALGALRALNEANINIPEEASLFGFDDIVLSKYVQPALSTVKQDMVLMGEEATKLLIGMMEGTIENRKDCFIPHEIKKRASLGANT